MSECTIGDILASDVFNSSGVILLAKDTLINEYIKERLIDLGIHRINIYDQYRSSENNNTPYKQFTKKYEETVIHTKKMIQDLAAGKPLDYQKVFYISSEIYKSINENDNIIRCLAEIRDVDEYTYTHCVNTAFYSMLIAKWLRISDEMNIAIQSGLLHDIGKSRIPSEILCKGGILTQEEYEVMKKHTILGYELVQDISEIDYNVKKAVLLHHERIDGSGYPLKASSDGINLYARIVAVADVFDAMTSDRVYKKRMTPFKVFEMFQTVGISVFDLRILRVFLNNLAAHLVGVKVLLNNGEVGEVVYVPLQDLTCPIVKVASGYMDLSKEKTVKISSMI